MSNNIPKIIHQLWLQTENYVPEDYKTNIETVKNLNKDFSYMFWDEIKILELIKDNNKYMSTYYSFEYMHQRIDFAKYIILYEFGGIFIDIDSYCIKELSKLYELVEEYDLVVSYVNTSFFESFIYCGSFTLVNNGNILSKPKADFLNQAINFIIENKNNIIIPIKLYRISMTTGPIFFNNIINNYKGETKIKILNPEYIEPCVNGGNCIITNNTYLVHEHSLTWLNDTTKHLLKTYFTHKNKILLLVILLIIVPLIYHRYKN